MDLRPMQDLSWCHTWECASTRIPNVLNWRHASTATLDGCRWPEMEVEEGSQEWDSRYYHAYMEGQELFDSRIAASAYRDSPSATTRLTRPSRIHTHLTHPPRTFTSLSIYLCTPRASQQHVYKGYLLSTGGAGHEWQTSTPSRAILLHEVATEPKAQWTGPSLVARAGEDGAAAYRSQRESTRI